MSDRILVTYAGRAGSTAGVAQAIGETLAAGGAEVEVRPMQEVKDLAPYRAVVAGSAIQGRRWLPEALRFVLANQVTLIQKPFAMFTVCTAMALRDGQYRQAVADWLKPVRALVRPVSEGYFAGAPDIGGVLPFGSRLKFRAGVAPGGRSRGDPRDWEAIRAWAGDLAARLQP